MAVLTGMPNHPTGVVPDACRGRARLKETVDGYGVVRTWLYATPSTGMLKKTFGHLFVHGFQRHARAPVDRKADVVVVSSPTFFSVFSAWILARCKRVALVVEVRDL